MDTNSSKSECSSFVLVDQCRCCLQVNNNLIDLWYHEIDGKIQNYGTVLIQVFGLQGPQWEMRTKGSMRICAECVTRLNDAHHFKETILNSDHILLNILAHNNVTIMTREEDDIKQEDASFAELQLEEEHLNTEDAPSSFETENMKSEDTSSSNEIEFVHGTDEENEGSDSEDGEESMIEQEEEEIEYLEEDILDENTSVSHVKAPVKKLNRAPREGHVSNATHMKLCNELRTILSLTNATPFKSKVGQVHCAYCLQRFPTSGQQLRAHCRATHADTRIARIDNAMSPPWLNEIVKVDIDSLHCTVCYKVIPSWSDMLNHLHIHNASIDLHSKLIPFRLGEDLQCALCSQNFPSFAALDYHMNAHYSNYICGKCGDTFLTLQRLNKHKKIHEAGKFPCKLCPKIFTQDKYRKKHVSIVHDKQPTYRCVECNEKFNKVIELKTHIDIEHEGKSTTYQCQQCNKVFQLKSYYLKHLRLKHTVRDKKLSCKLCDKKFHYTHELKNHIKWHQDDDNLICKYCNMKLCNKSYLQKHMEKVHKHKADRINFII